MNKNALLTTASILIISSVIGACSGGGNASDNTPTPTSTPLNQHNDADHAH